MLWFIKGTRHFRKCCRRKTAVLDMHQTSTASNCSRRCSCHCQRRGEFYVKIDGAATPTLLHKKMCLHDENDLFLVIDVVVVKMKDCSDRNDETKCHVKRGLLVLFSLSLCLFCFWVKKRGASFAFFCPCPFPTASVVGSDRAREQQRYKRQRGPMVPKAKPN